MHRDLLTPYHKELSVALGRLVPLSFGDLLVHPVTDLIVSVRNAAGS